MAERLPPFDVRALRVLVVDDDENMRNMFVDVLRSFGIEDRRTAGSAGEGLNVLGAMPVDIIFCEWQLPGVNGVEFTRKLRTGAVTPNRATPIIFATSHTQVWNVTTARDAGITEYLAKPISARIIYSRICSVIERPRTFIEADNFVGPDRRRQRDPYKVGEARRDTDRVTVEIDGGPREISEDEINAMLGL